MRVLRRNRHLLCDLTETCALSDQTDLTKGQDDSSKVVEEASGRGAPNPRAGGRPSNVIRDDNLHLLFSIFTVEHVNLY